MFREGVVPEIAQMSEANASSRKRGPPALKLALIYFAEIVVPLEPGRDCYFSAPGASGFR